MLLHSHGSRDLGACPSELERMRVFLTKGLTQTASLWADVEQGYAWVHRAAQRLRNDKKQTAAEVRQGFEDPPL